VGSANDKNAVIIEVSPKISAYTECRIPAVCFVPIIFSLMLIKMTREIRSILKKVIQNTAMKSFRSFYRKKKLNPEKMASILRNTSGLKDEKIGYGNEKALNQLLAHHAVIFSPQKKLVWVSSNPYQLGRICML
jgi:hypothetical protein